MLYSIKGVKMKMNKKGEDGGASGVGTQGLMIIGGLIILAILIVVILVNNGGLVAQIQKTISLFLG